MMAKPAKSKPRRVLPWVILLIPGNIVALIFLGQKVSQQNPISDDNNENRLLDANNQLYHQPEEVDRIRQQEEEDIIVPNEDHGPQHPMHQGRRRKMGHLKKGELSTTTRSNNNNFTHYFLHIPKAGGTFARTQLNQDMRHFKAKKGIMCDRGVSPVSQYKVWPTHYGRRTEPCAMYMTESHWSPVPDHVYTIVRDPREQIVSAYFHCKEGNHAKRYGDHLMPDTLEEWLNAWVDVKRAEGTPQQQQRALQKANEFHCYNPINLQSTMLLADDQGQANNILPSTKERLTQRFAVLGLTSQMNKSLCLVFLHWNGFVPKRCRCGEGANNKHHLRLGAKHTHNVTNHGSTHQHTPHQLAAIQELADVDLPLYSVAKELFAEQVAEVERKYSIQLC